MLFLIYGLLVLLTIGSLVIFIRFRRKHLTQRPLTVGHFIWFLVSVITLFFSLAGLVTTALGLPYDISLLFQTIFVFLGLDVLTYTAR